MKGLQTIVMIPTYDEAANIERMLRRLLALHERLGCLVIDDDSPDGTAAIVKRVQADFPDRVQLIVRSGGRQGRASAGIRGLQEAAALGPEYVVEIDADFSYNPDEILNFLEAIDDCDVVVGSRFVAGGQDADRGFVRTRISRVSSRVFRAVLGVRLRDMGSGFKLYRRQVLQSLPWSEFLSSGIAISMEELFRIVRRGWRVKEVPIQFVDRREGQSKLRTADFVEPALIAVRLAWALGRAGPDEESR